MPATARVDDLIAAVRAAGGTIRPDGDMIELRAPHPLPSDLVARIREAKPALLAALADWPARHREALAYWGLLHRAGEAERLAWGEMLTLWHKRYGRRWPEWQCGGCDAPIGGLGALDLADGNRVHLADNLDCLFHFGERWRGEAAAGLRALGLQVPPGGCDR